MTSVLVEVANAAAVNAAAVRRLRLQQGVRVVGVIEEPNEAATVDMPAPKPSVASLIGSLSPDSAKRMLQQNAELRDEWEREF